MSSSNYIMLRVQSSEGNKRIEIKPNDSISRLFEKVHEAFSLTGFAFALFRERNNRGEVISSRSKTVAGSGLRHGDLLYMVAQNGAKLWAAPGTTSDDMAGPSTSTVVPLSPPPATPSPSGSREKAVTGVEYVNNHNGRSSNGTQEDEVDQMLWKMDGKIERKRDEKLCRHLRNGRCLHCSPLEPYDETYLKEQNIKHMSFHAFLRKLTAGMDRGKFVCLEDMSCRIKPGCKGHLPWPHGICTKCQPNAVTLNRQVYRHVDNAMFENAHLVERFLNYWRTTGHQRIGYLYGRHEIHADVPLGIRATIAAIYEPPQESTRDQIKLLLDEKEAVVEELASQLGLKRVGWIFTDLVAEDLSKGTVKHVRNINSHFLSAQECIMAGHFQNRHPNPCRFSSSGYFGSKFVTICVTGDVSNQVHMEGYSVSNQCMALVRDQCLLPTKDAPELGYIKDSTSQQFVPDVYYKEKDSYGNEVPRMARPLPVEYLLVDVPASTPLTPLFTFHADNNVRPFAVENRLVDGHIQDFAALSSYLQQFSSEQFLAAVSDFHFLLYIATMETLPMKEHMGVLLAAVREGDGEAAAKWARGDHWATLEQLIAAAGRDGGGAERSPSGSDQAMPQAPEWTCPHCTFLNLPHHNTCDMCSLPR